MYHHYTGSFFLLSKWLEEMRFRVIRYKFEKFFDHSLITSSFVGGCKGKFLPSVEIASMETFYDHSQSIEWVLGPSNSLPPTLGVTAGGIFHL